MSDQMKLAITDRYEALPESERKILQRVAADCNAAGRSISISQQPSQRRHAITEALCDWCDYGWDDEVVLTALINVTQKVGSIGTILSKISTHHAETFGKLARDLTAGRVDLAITLDGITFNTKKETS